MRLIRTRELTPALTKELLTLKEHCEAHASRTYSFHPEDLDPELSGRYYLIYEGDLLISALIVSVLTDSDSPFFDFFAMTEPKYQRQGFFSDLLDEMLEDLDEEFPDVEISSDLFLEKDMIIPGFLENLGYEETSREYLMEIPRNPTMPSQVSLMKTTDRNLLSSCYSTIFQVTKKQAEIAFEELIEFNTWYLLKVKDSLIGMVLLMEEGNSCYLCNFGILPEHRGKGYALEALKAIQNRIPTKITLQVSSANAPAFSLYKKYGFRITKEYVCYHQTF